MAAGGDLASISATPSFGNQMRPEFKVITDRTEDGTRQSALKSSAVQRNERLPYRNQTNAQKAAMDTFWSDNQGPYSGFTWTDPRDSVNRKYAFPKDFQYEPTQNTAGQWEWELELEFRK